ncbi:MAG: murein L,D-transpeptidase catalytic domain family protein [Bacteroidales bacterium]|nr:murein L,D-transpeptidase catalytic domain family protein [Bacteroidales bacterium]
MIDIRNQRLLFNTLVAHGRNTGEEFAQRFSSFGHTEKHAGFFVRKIMLWVQLSGCLLLSRSVEKDLMTMLSVARLLCRGRVCHKILSGRPADSARSYGCPSLPPDLN